jgi:hypothetical protein
MSKSSFTIDFATLKRITEANFTYDEYLQAMGDCALFDPDAGEGISELWGIKITAHDTQDYTFHFESYEAAVKFKNEHNL